ncbi:MAG: tetratricopeptide repeat protein, partial [Pseudomonadota bacterium]
AAVGAFAGPAPLLHHARGAPIRVTRTGGMPYPQVLSQIERSDDALAHLSETFGDTEDPTIIAMKAALETGDTMAFDIVETPQDGVAEVYHSIAGALVGEAQDNLTLIYARMAMALRPDHVESVLMTAELLERLERYGLATQVYDAVPRESAAFFDAEIGRAGALSRSGRDDAAIEVLKQLTESHGDLPNAHIALGDALRGMDRFEESVVAYDAAFERIDEVAEQHWIVYFARAIAFERQGMWPEAEADFRASLALRPEQPQVLNYLGYSFLELQTNLDEALDMIERAAALRPDAGHIIDSLGWGLYRVGRFEEAVGHMERAVELMPVDPVVNDHLGDVYWAVGRQREAEFQWHRALSFITDDTNMNDIDPDRIRRKLEVGLDVVLEEEGAPPIELANDEG